MTIHVYLYNGIQPISFELPKKFLQFSLFRLSPSGCKKLKFDIRVIVKANMIEVENCNTIRKLFSGGAAQ